MSRPKAYEAIVQLMVATSAADRRITEVELARIAQVTRTWPLFEDFRQDRLHDIARRCEQRLAEPEGTETVIAEACKAIPEHVHDTAYAAAFEVAAVDLEMHLDELRVLQLLRSTLAIDALTVAAIERANKARQRVLP